VARKAAAEVLNAGTYDSIAGADSFGDINRAFPAPGSASTSRPSCPEEKAERETPERTCFQMP
jgi:hypothetical protein